VVACDAGALEYVQAEALPPGIRPFYAPTNDPRPMTFRTRAIIKTPPLSRGQKRIIRRRKG
jgi:hypothetical protein